jgi:hypothetical protein
MAGTIRKKNRGLIQAVLLLLIAAFVIWKVVGFWGGSGSNACEFTQRLATRDLEYVDHARCRMACRDIDQALVEKVYLQGALNCKKSSIKNGKHRYALELRDSRGDMIRIIVEDEQDKHVIVTAIRLDQEDECACS